MKSGLKKMFKAHIALWSIDKTNKMLKCDKLEVKLSDSLLEQLTTLKHVINLGSIYTLWLAMLLCNTYQLNLFQYFISMLIFELFYLFFTEPIINFFLHRILSEKYKKHHYAVIRVLATLIVIGIPLLSGFMREFSSAAHAEVLCSFQFGDSQIEVRKNDSLLLYCVNNLCSDYQYNHTLADQSETCHTDTQNRTIMNSNGVIEPIDSFIFQNRLHQIYILNHNDTITAIDSSLPEFQIFSDSKLLDCSLDDLMPFKEKGTLIQYQTNEIEWHALTISSNTYTYSTNMRRFIRNQQSIQYSDQLQIVLWHDETLKQYTDSQWLQFIQTIQVANN